MFGIKGDEPMWAPLHRMLLAGDVGQVFSYAELSVAAGHDVQLNRGPLFQAIRRLELDNQRTAQCVRSVGYQIAEAREHRGIALSHKRKARRSVSRGLRKANAADLSRLTPQEHQALQATQIQFDSYQRMLTNHEGRLAKVERVTAEIQETRAADKALELEQLRRNLENLGIKLPVEKPCE